MSVNVAVIGAGVIGLSTALNVQRVVPGARVTVIADKFYEQTTSYGSGGLFIPSAKSFPDVPIEDLRKWTRTSWQFYKDLALGSEAGSAGTIVMSGYHLQNTDFGPNDPLYKEIVFHCEEMSRTDMETLGFQEYRHGLRMTTIVIYMRKYLVWLRKRFERNGGVLVRKRVSSLEELSGAYDLVMNCCGTGSQELVGDTQAYPVRGHIVRIKAPWIKHWIHTDDERYIIPGETLVGLGTVAQKGKDSLTVDPKESREIIEKCERLCPNIKGAEIDHEWIGVRPGRTSIRLEVEIMNFGQKSLPVVHNYGHESHGVGLSWGTSVHAADLAAKLLSSRTTSKL